MSLIRLEINFDVALVLPVPKTQFVIKGNGYNDQYLRKKQVKGTGLTASNDKLCDGLERRNPIVQCIVMKI